ncbi:uncharacterized protein DUF1003 [Propionicimonas paludicola]|uniref:Uncharacterized protein DUF1003 n=1 Tax=Propionicimonas paludicola TaxID=185243 RepID=A0A2A9CS82_9ACTN|nr:DUF1003 domain-containing protein [Propionicimonas paludicola]PFG17294.1 uncharacterized protein DUF1003 [Propionicimonas paludicola]
MAKQDRLDTPGRRSAWLPRLRMDQDTFGSFAETFARWMGTANFIIWMTIVIIIWLIWNVNDPNAPDRWPFAFLTLALSLQASYAAPLILLAQNRQEARDRVSLEHDRQVAAQSRADMDFLAREIASLRMRMNDVATRDFIRSELRDLLAELSEDPEQERPAK